MVIRVIEAIRVIRVVRVSRVVRITYKATRLAPVVKLLALLSGRYKTVLGELRSERLRGKGGVEGSQRR